MDFLIVHLKQRDNNYNIPEILNAIKSDFNAIIICYTDNMIQESDLFFSKARELKARCLVLHCPFRKDQNKNCC